MRSVRACNNEAGRPAVAAGIAGAGLSQLSIAMGKLQAWRKRARIEAALASLEDFQLDDLGIMRADIPAYARAAAGAPRLMQGMLQRLHLEPGAQERRDLLRTCRTCPNVAACERWLARGEPAEGYRRFCPNATLLDRLRGTAPDRARLPA